MSIDIQKPLPLKIGNTYHYTLSSYEPVSVTVFVPYILDEDVDNYIDYLAAHNQIAREEMTDAWVAENLGAPDFETLKRLVRGELERSSADFAESSKQQLCIQALAERLNQQVPQEVLQATFEELAYSFKQDAAEHDALDTLLNAPGMSMDMLDSLLYERAVAFANEQAALSAYAAEKNVEVDESELPGILQMTPADAAELIASAKEAHQLDNLLAQCKDLKATRILTAEAHCSYHHETEQEALERVEAAKAEERAHNVNLKDVSDPNAHPAPSEHTSAADKGFKLV
jgi:FKBP-type peptidyl-prolyl cis-trans isomerase (trigger factor)